ncbi:hypothetical protein CGMCC3_g17979 [Colletotrichum fructicola]|uniref:Uncharacterized protein n=1 Tax=Colletotrichum fructicola (strain Nara gc5) TaxID=1213859 RepID=A0A7J6IDT8_COLFN|nr:uncharacterized protein CGMCC3_g17979 [Colletotrichum fructicola]KAF4474110.1 hypothetical protein CGGC5_v017124 [Colletotrichum fructicola Nara gc5]KAE9565842.1 hypothetical protein CGMCC3_g17979 [Colletotrichum fructicola]KAF4474488.1 hypothetical protein CGGC5_v016842 [Colletotrichum fructicola Nara gc5]KAF4474497.1 hypothetical protein CGGC5_v016826 [Colletotrichum fructicola Nara gc5]KAF4474615.1 hypothetical protein CGGC5_v017041 [Colletotrichum fructicola Nara gc5]
MAHRDLQLRPKLAREHAHPPPAYTTYTKTQKAYIHSLLGSGTSYKFMERKPIRQHPRSCRAQQGLQSVQGLYFEHCGEERDHKKTETRRL